MNGAGRPRACRSGESGKNGSFPHGFAQCDLFRDFDLLGLAAAGDCRRMRPTSLFYCVDATRPSLPLSIYFLMTRLVMHAGGGFGQLQSIPKYSWRIMAREVICILAPLCVCATRAPTVGGCVKLSEEEEWRHETRDDRVPICTAKSNGSPC